MKIKYINTVQVKESFKRMSYRIISSIPLTQIEKFLCADGGWMTVAHAVHLTGDRSILTTNASNVIQCLLKRHPRMRTRIRVDDDNRYFLDNLEYNSEYLSSDLYLSIVDSSTESWQDMVERKCNQDPYSNNGTIIFPTFHFMILFNSQKNDDDSFHLLVFHNHCVSDGRSGFILINDFLTLATTSNITEPLNTEILPLITQMIPRPYGPLFSAISVIAKQVFKRELRQMTHPRIPVKVTPLDDCGPTKSNKQRYKTNFLHTSSSTDLFPKLHQQCRREEVTLNGPLLACLLLTIHRCHPIGDKTKLEPFSIGTPYDMRARLSQSPLTSSSVGFFVGIGMVKLKRTVPIRTTRFWSLAHNCMRLAQDQLKRNGVPLMMHVFARLLNNRRDFSKITRLCPEGRESEFAFSNIGKYPYSCTYAEGKLQIQGIHVVNNCSLYRNSSAVYATYCGQGQLDFSLAHEMESDEKAKSFLDCYLRLIEICADSERCKSDTTLEDLLNML